MRLRAGMGILSRRSVERRLAARSVGSIVALLVFACLAAGNAEAQVPRIQFGGGLSTPSGDLNTGLDRGFHVRASIGLSFPVFPLSVRADGELHQFSETFTTDNYRIVAGTLNTTANLFALGMLGTGGQLYAVGGVGYFSLDPSIGSTSSELGGQLGLGANVGALGFGGMLEVKFVNIFVDGNTNARYIPITVGIKF